MVIGMTQLKEVDINEQVNKQLNHTADGFVDIENSSAGIHLELVGIGITAGFSHPFGYGLGFPTVAGLKAGGFSSEINSATSSFAVALLSDCFICSLFSWCFVRPFDIGEAGAIRLHSMYLRSSCWSLGHWLAGGLYAVCPLTWFAIGVLDRASSPLRPVRPRPRWQIGHRFVRLPRRRRGDDENSLCDAQHHPRERTRPDSV